MDDSEKTRPPKRMLVTDSPAELLGQAPRLADLVKLRPLEGEAGLRFLNRLRASTTPEEAVTYAAFAALPNVAVGWGYECLRSMADHLSPLERPMMQEVATWLSSPSMSLRHKIMRDALYAPSRTPSVLLGLAVGWSTGGPAPNDPEPAPAHKAPVALNAAVLSCLARVPLARRPVHLARVLDMAETLFRVY
ncbi:MAG: hypothetical protein Q4G24_15020 [Paracoccus sp. (in: a-proteobacteria)]|uniref:DUF6931 family protein n=1 Tax=Paracoccus sp. TaxID=267 RepID=UPI0026DF5427|nr:hypothetical protein [Paracoccus sp. (in: a-proteobacteria)]MDO5622764.1 hypothetical protein [Paracoccus sp. (in: a-proteobacteria)]